MIFCFFVDLLINLCYYVEEFILRPYHILLKNEEDGV